MNWSITDSRFVMNRNTQRHLEIETLLSNRQKIAYIKRNIDRFYQHTRINQENRSVTPDTVSIVMTSSNRSKQTYYTLDTISCDKYKDVQVILVDDSTTDHIQTDVLKRYPFIIDFIRIIPDKKIWGNPCVNYNIGFQFIEGGKVIIQNAEVCHVDNVVDYVHKNVYDNIYTVFDVIATNSLQHNEMLYLKPIITTEIYSDKKIFEDGRWYQSATHRNRKFHFLAATTRSTFNKIGGFSYDYAIGNAYDDDDFVLRIESLDIEIRCVDHFNVKCGGIHLYHTPSEETWGNKLPMNDLIFQEKKKYYETTKRYKEIILI